MQRFLIFICFTISTIFVPLSLGGAPPERKTRIQKSKVNQKPFAPSSSVAVTVQVVPAAPLPSSFALGQNYPNPYNASTVISYSCGQDGFVSLKVYNILGQEITTLVSENKRAGFYSVRWDSKDRYGNPLATGIYFYRMIAGQFVETKKLVLVR